MPHYSNWSSPKEERKLILTASCRYNIPASAKNSINAFQISLTKVFNLPFAMLKP